MISSGWIGFEQYLKLASAYGPPGMEHGVRDELSRLLTPYADRLETDRIGNLYATVGKCEGPVIMISAHMDEVALIVSGVTREGLLRVKPQGHLNPEHFDHQRVVILTMKGFVNGVSLIVRTSKKPTIADVRIDTGSASIDDVERLGIQLGDRVCYHAEIKHFPEGIIRGKSADDRVGLYVMVEIARQLAGKEIPYQTVLTGTVQEEAVDTYAAWAGAFVAATRVKPALMLGIDTIDVSKERSGDELEPSLEDGIGILRGAQDLHHGLVEHLLKTARNRGLTHQIIPLPSTAADYTTVMRAGVGVPCAGLAIPVLNSHSSNEIFLWKTLKDSIRLIMEILEDANELIRISNEMS